MKPFTRNSFKTIQNYQIIRSSFQREEKNSFEKKVVWSTHTHRHTQTHTHRHTHTDTHTIHTHYCLYDWPLSLSLDGSICLSPSAALSLEQNKNVLELGGSEFQTVGEMKLKPAERSPTDLRLRLEILPASNAARNSSFLVVHITIHSTYFQSSSKRYVEQRFILVVW